MKIILVFYFFNIKGIDSSCYLWKCNVNNFSLVKQISPMNLINDKKEIKIKANLCNYCNLI